jgi:hypothetical protein
MRGLFRIFAATLILGLPGLAQAQEPGAAQHPETGEKAAPAPQPNARQRIVLIGDSLAEGMGPSLAEALSDMPGIALERHAKAETGLVRSDFYDWNRALADILAQGPASAVIVLIGLNDRQAISSPQGRFPPGTEGWRNAYAKRVDALLDQAKAKGARVYWVGLPPVQGRALSADVADLNEIFRARAEHAGARFVDVWNAFADQEGGYVPSGPDLTGTVRRLRAGDGVHFTRAGNQKLAHFVQREIRRDFGDRGVPAGPSAGPVPGPGTAAQAAAAPNASAAPNVSAAPKPAGPAVSLTGANQADGAGLAGERRPRAEGRDEQALRAGRTPPPKAGRGDDFRWSEPRR